jgi:hypothetical protein
VKLERTYNWVKPDHVKLGETRVYNWVKPENIKLGVKNQDQTLPHLCACLKARSAFLTSYNSYMYIKAYNNSIYNNKSKNRKKV